MLSQNHKDNLLRYNTLRVTGQKQTPSQLAAHQLIDQLMTKVATELSILLPDSRDKVLTFEDLERLSRSAHKCVAVDGMPMFIGEPHE